MVAEPAATPFTIPEELPIVATAVLELAHVPPGTVFVNVAKAPAHKLEAPSMIDGGLTVMVLDAVAASPQASVEVTV